MRVAGDGAAQLRARALHRRPSASAPTPGIPARGAKPTMGTRSRPNAAAACSTLAAALAAATALPAPTFDASNLRWATWCRSTTANAAPAAAPAIAVAPAAAIG